MQDARFHAELTPHRNRVGHWGCYVVGDVRFSVADRLIPSVLVLLADIIAVRVVMIFSKIERVDSAAASMYQRIAESSYHRVIAPFHEDRITRIRFDLDTKLYSR